jgi:hypothetical protein
MYQDQAGLHIAAVGPAVAAFGPIVGPAFLAGSKMSGPVGHLRKCRTFLEMSDRLRPAWTSSIGPALSNSFEELFRVGQITFKSYLELDQQLYVNSLQCLNLLN